MTYKVEPLKPECGYLNSAHLIIQEWIQTNGERIDHFREKINKMFNNFYLIDLYDEDSLEQERAIRLLQTRANAQSTYSELQIIPVEIDSLNLSKKHKEFEYFPEDDAPFWVLIGIK